MKNYLKKLIEKDISDLRHDIVKMEIRYRNMPGKSSADLDAKIREVENEIAIREQYILQLNKINFD